MKGRWNLFNALLLQFDEIFMIFLVFSCLIKFGYKIMKIYIMMILV